MAINLSDEKLRILRSGESGVVVAGAGSGKTTLLAASIRDDVRDREIPVERLLVVAFNNAAAAHLVSRIGVALGESAQDDEPAADVSEAWVGTFHSLCARIVRERPFAAGVAPEPVVIDEIESRVLQEAALDDALEMTGNPLMLDMLTAVGVDRARGAARALLDRRRSAGVPRPTFDLPEVAKPDLATLRRAIAAVVATPLTEKRQESVDQTREGVTRGDWREMRAMTRDYRGAGGNARCAYNEAVWQVQAALRDREALPLLDAFRTFFEAFRDGYAASKMVRGAIDFEDLQLHARQLIRDHADVRARYTFDRVYVDEAQDINPLQDELIRLLSEGSRRSLRVGDAAQAIYRFRWADVRCFTDAIETTKAFPLRENYRSDEPVLAVLNGWFDNVFADGDTPFAHLAAKAGVGHGDAPQVELVVVESEEGSPSREAEAAEVARVVTRMHEHDGIAPGEIAVLFRARTGIAIYDRALRQAGFETVLVGGTVLAEEQGVRDVLALLRLLENPHDEPALIRALAAPYAAASDDDLLALRRSAGPNGALWDALRRGDVPSLVPFRDALVNMRERRAGLELVRIVEESLALCAFELATLGMEGGGLRYANLRRLVQMAAAFGRVRGADVRGFVRFVEAAPDLGADPGEATLIDEDMDAVRLLTVHGAKGQEFEGVVVADASNRGGGGQPAVLVDEHGRVGFSASLDGLGTNDPCFAYEQLCDDEKLRDAAEERRIGYVALTRAKHRLAVVGRSRQTQNGRSFEGMMRFLVDGAAGQLPPIGETNDITLGSGILRVRSTIVDPPPQASIIELADQPPVMACDRPPPAIVVPPPVEPLRGMRMSYSAIQLETADETGTPVVLPVDYEGAGNKAFGERFHEALERINWRAPALDIDMFEQAERDRAQRLFAAIRDGDVGKRLAAAVEIHTERKFLYQLDGMILDGAVDVWASETDGTILIVDWKTGTRHLEDDEPFALQRAIYALASLRTGATVVETAWVLLERDATVVGGRPATAELEEYIRRTLARAYTASLASPNR